MLRCLVQRMSSEEIAEKLHMCINTVKTHKRDIYNKMGAYSKDDVIIIAHNYHLTELSEVKLEVIMEVIMEVKGEVKGTIPHEQTASQAIVQPVSLA